MAMMRRVAALNESFNRHVISWNEWSAQATPLLCALNPELHHGAVLDPRRERVEGFPESLAGVHPGVHLGVQTASETRKLEHGLT